MRLAWRQGRCLRELLLVLPPDELPLWIAFERLEGPLGPEREDLQAGVTAAVVSNMFRKKNQEPLTAWDFCPDWSGDLKGARKRAKLQRQAQRLKARAEKARQLAEIEELEKGQ